VGYGKKGKSYVQTGTGKSPTLQNCIQLPTDFLHELLLWWVILTHNRQCGARPEPVLTSPRTGCATGLFVEEDSLSVKDRARPRTACPRGAERFWKHGASLDSPDLLHLSRVESKSRWGSPL